MRHPRALRPRLAFVFLAVCLAAEPATSGDPGPDTPRPSSGDQTQPSLDDAVSELPRVPLSPGDGSPGNGSPDATTSLDTVSDAVPSRVPGDETAIAVRSRPVLDPAARMLGGDDASESWNLYVELESGHRITQRFLVTNAGPGDHNAVAVGHLIEPGRKPYRYENGRRRPRWTLSDDRLFFDIAASHLDLHRPRGELRITKDDIEIRLFFDFSTGAAAARVPRERLPGGYNVEVLAVAAETEGTIAAPWMTRPVETRGRTWLVHTWTKKDEARLLSRRVDLFGSDGESAFYGVHLRSRGDWESGWSLVTDRTRGIIESPIKIPASWNVRPAGSGGGKYPTPRGFEVDAGNHSGQITLGREWLRFDPLDVLPQPFKWFVRSRSKPQEVWADARIGVRISPAPGPPSLPVTGDDNAGPDVSDPGTSQADASIRTDVRENAEQSTRETGYETAERSLTGVAFVTFLNPMKK